MRTIGFIIQKEFIQIFRNRAMLPLIFLMPIIQLLILANAATYEIRNIQLAVVDQDHSQMSRRLVNKLGASEWFELVDVGQPPSQDLALHAIEQGDADLILTIPSGFNRDMIRDHKGSLHLNIDAINGSKASLGFNYAQSIIADFNAEIRSEYLELPPGMQLQQVDISYANWFNPELNFTTFMVPGILVLLVTMIGMFLSGMNIVREKEIGTIEQLNVTPIRKHHFIIGKLLPFWFLGLFELAFGLGIGLLVFDIPFVGDPFLIFGFAALYLLVVLGMGLLVSTFTNTQQQAMFISWFFMVIFILMSGLFTPIESMPDWAQKITWFNPIAYFVKVIRMVILKGSGFAEIAYAFGVIAAFAVGVNTLAIWNYRKTT